MTIDPGKGQTPVSVLYDSKNAANVHESVKDFYDTLLREVEKEVSTNAEQRNRKTAQL